MPIKNLLHTIGLISCVFLCACASEDKHAELKAVQTRTQVYISADKNAVTLELQDTQNPTGRMNANSCLVVDAEVTMNGLRLVPLSQGKRVEGFKQESYCENPRYTLTDITDVYRGDAVFVVKDDSTQFKVSARDLFEAIELNASPQTIQRGQTLTIDIVPPSFSLAEPTRSDIVFFSGPVTDRPNWVERFGEKARAVGSKITSPIDVSIPLGQIKALLSRNGIKRDFVFAAEITACEGIQACRVEVGASFTTSRSDALSASFTVVE